MLRPETEERLNKIKDKKNLIGKNYNGKIVTLKNYYSYIKEMCRNDIQLFSLMFLSHYNTFPHNKFHIDSFTLLERKEKRLAIAASRGLAKSSVYSLTDTLHDICYVLENYILLLSNTETQALSHSKNIIYELTGNEKIIAVFGNLIPSKKTSPQDFICSNDVKLSARGSDSSLRGIRHKASRPTKIILDDVEDAETVGNPATREKFEEVWFKKEVSPLGSVDTKIIMIGTILHEDSLLTNTQNNAAYLKKTYPMVLQWDNEHKLWETWRSIYVNKDNENHLIDSDLFYEQNKEKMLDGTSVIWPEKDDYLSIQKKIVEIGRPSFLQEYQMESLDLSKVLFNQFYYFDMITDPVQGEGIKTHHGRFIPISGLDVYMSIDPTAGSKDQTKGDCTSIILGYVNVTDSKENRRLFAFHDWTKNAKPSEWIEMMFILADTFNVQKITIEENLYRNFLKENLSNTKKELIQKGKIKDRDFSIKEVLSQTNKEKRIIQLEPKIHGSSIQFIRQGLSQNFWSQLKNYIPNGKCKDDVPDSLEILWTSVRGFTGAGVADKYQQRHLQE